MANVSKTQLKILRAMLTGQTLKAHRYLDGRKVYKLHALDGQVEPVRWSTVEALKSRSLIDSNKKFPAATYLMTETGRRLAETLDETATLPLSAKNYG